MRMPQTHPMATTHTAMRKEVPAPLRTRLKMSRPKLSVPSRWRREGAWFLAEASMAVGP